MLTIKISCDSNFSIRVRVRVVQLHRNSSNIPRTRKNVYDFCWKIGVKWRYSIGQIPLQFGL